MIFGNKQNTALASVAQWIGVTSSIPSQSTCLGCGWGPRWGARERQLISVISHALVFLSLSSSLPSPLFKSK